jgi:hypothetical protein
MFSWVIASTLVVGAPALKERAEPDRPPTGEWRIERCEHEGRAGRILGGDRVWLGERSVEIGSRGQFAFLCKYSVVFFRVDGERRADLTYVSNLPPGTRPNAPADAPPERAIWKNEGDRLTICIGAPGGSRPTDYSAPEGSGRTLYVLRNRVSD